MNRIRLLFCFFTIFRYIPHILYFYFGKNRSLIKSDLDSDSLFKSLIYNLCWYKPYRNLFYHRVGRAHFIFSWMLPRCPYTTVSQDMKIGDHCKFVHPYNTFLNAYSIGRNFKCYHNVTVGALGDKANIPTIGDNVVLSCGSTVLGKISIGDNVVIGAGAVVVHDIPANCTVIGNPAKIVKKNGKKIE